MGLISATGPAHLSVEHVELQFSAEINALTFRAEFLISKRFLLPDRIARGIGRIGLSQGRQRLGLWSWVGLCAIPPNPE